AVRRPPRPPRTRPRPASLARWSDPPRHRRRREPCSEPSTRPRSSPGVYQGWRVGGQARSAGEIRRIEGHGAAPFGSSPPPPPPPRGPRTGSGGLGKGGATASGEPSVRLDT